MSEKFLARIINLLNRAQPDGLTFDALTFHLYNSEQDFFGERPDMRSVSSTLRTILDAYSTHITLDSTGSYHLRKGIPQQLTINFDIPQEPTKSEIVISEPSEADYGEQLLLDLFEDTEDSQASIQAPPPSPFPTLFDDDPNFI